MPGRRIHDLLDTMDMACKRGHDNATLGKGKDAVQLIPHTALGTGEAGNIGVGAVGEQKKNTAEPQFGKPLHSRRTAVDWSLIKLEVTTVNHGADRGVYAESHAGGNAVRDFQELDAERTEAQFLAGRDLIQRGLSLKTVLPQLGVDQPNGKSRSVNGNVDLFEQIRQRSYVILVTVGDDNTEHTIPVLNHIGEIRQDEIDTQHVIVREHQPRIDHKNGIAILEDHHILSDGPQPPQRDDLKRLRNHR